LAGYPLDAWPIFLTLATGEEVGGGRRYTVHPLLLLEKERKKEKECKI